MEWFTIRRLKRVRVPLFVVLAAVASACSEAPTESAPSEDRVSRTTAAARPRVVFLGDSLTAGLGLPADEAYPALLQQKIEQAALGFEVVNAGVSGDTSAGGLRRLDWVLDGDVRVLVVALGANDGLRGLPVAELERNLETIVSTARSRGVTVLLAGMEAPPNVGSEYTTAFREAYRNVARSQGVPLVPFLLDGVAGRAELNQPDGIHPNAAGARRVADTMWPALEPLLRSAGHS
jgi:acyl-CoA thioesterase-1